MAAENLYPFSSPQGAIPLEIAKPKSLASFSFAANAVSAITIPAGYSTCWLYATEDCIIRVDGTALPAALVSGTEYANSMFVPAKTPMSVMLAGGVASLLGLATAGILYINSIAQWAAIAQQYQADQG